MLTTHFINGIPLLINDIIISFLKSGLSYAFDTPYAYAATCCDMPFISFYQILQITHTNTNKKNVMFVPSLLLKR